MRNVYFVVLSLFSVIANASTKIERVSEQPASSEPAIQTDQRSFSQIFDTNLVESRIQAAPKLNKTDLEFSFVANSISGSPMPNDYYSIDLANQAPSPLMLRITASREIFASGQFSIRPFLGLGYSFQESEVEAEAKSRDLYRDIVRIQWAPLSIGTNFEYRLQSLKATKLFVRVLTSYDWFSVAGNLDGITQSYWAPMLGAGVGASFFEPSTSDLEQWFGGLSISGGVSHHLKEDRGMEASWLELGVRILL